MKESSLTTTRERTRFAPSPSGELHIGNIRAALISFLLAKETGGHFILRIEDTDQTRSESRYYTAIFSLLSWLGISPDEGPQEGGPSAPYVQSERTEIYQKFLTFLQEKNVIYRCFKSEEELEKEKTLQKALKKPPRYCRATLSSDQVQELLSKNTPFVWRIKLPEKEVTFFDTALGEVRYDLTNFADFPLTRTDGSFTFLFANFVDDVAMNITTVIRGKEHMSNTVLQIALYEAAEKKLPRFSHVPLLGNSEGKKLSKRKGAFSLTDLQREGYLAEAIVNYLLTIGGGKREEELFSLEEAQKQKIASQLLTHSANIVCYDEKKLLWYNRQWLQRISLETFKERVVHYCTTILPLSSKEQHFFTTSLITNLSLLATIKKEISLLKEINEYIATITLPGVSPQTLPPFGAVIQEVLSSISVGEEHTILAVLRQEAKQRNIPLKELLHSLRILLTGQAQGCSLSLLITSYSGEELRKRIMIGKNNC